MTQSEICDFLKKNKKWYKTSSIATKLNITASTVHKKVRQLYYFGLIQRKTTTDAPTGKKIYVYR